jgi:hypothetical protein
MAPIYDIIVIGDFDYSKKFKKNNVKMLMFDSRSSARICEVHEVHEVHEVCEDNLNPDYLDYDFVSDLL